MKRKTKPTAAAPTTTITTKNSAKWICDIKTEITHKTMMMMILEQITITITNMHMLCVSFRVMSRSTQFTRNTEHSIVTRVYFYTSLSYSDEEPTVRFLFFQPNNNYFRTPNRMKCFFSEEFSFFLLISFHIIILFALRLFY